MSVSDILALSGVTCTGGLVAVLTIIQIIPVNLNPWSYISKKVGKALNAEVMDDVKTITTPISDKIDDLKAEIDLVKNDLREVERSMSYELKGARQDSINRYNSSKESYEGLKVELKKDIESVKEFDERRCCKTQEHLSETILELKDSIKSLKDEIIEIISEADATDARHMILVFSDEILRKIKHSEEHFNQILLKIKQYEKYCETHPDYPNDQCVFAIENIRDTYKRVLLKNDFL